MKVSRIISIAAYNASNLFGAVNLTSFKVDASFGLNLACLIFCFFALFAVDVKHNASDYYFCD